MSFANTIAQRLSQVSREPQWSRDEAARYMAGLDIRRQSFTQLTEELMTHIIQPRVELLVSHFANAAPGKEPLPGRCSYWFGYSERFPTSTKLELSVEHDPPFEKLIVCYEARMMPVFIKFNERDRLTLPLSQRNDEIVANWVEQRLLEFLDAYLQIDRGREDFQDETVTDPVCGMRISRSSAVACESFHGHAYFFCSAQCQAEFALNPAAHVKISGL